MRAKELSKQDRIKKEIGRLRRLLKNIPKDKLQTAEGVIKRIAFMQITLEDLETDINEKGAVEMFSQTEGIQYERERPATRIYNATIKNYTAACKQLFDLIPDDGSRKQPGERDDLMSFLKGTNHR